MKLSTETVLEALKKVTDPESGKDLVSLDRVRQLEVSPDGRILVRVFVENPESPYRARIEESIQKTLSQLEGVSNVFVQVNSDPRTQKKAPAIQRMGNSQAIPGVKHVIAVSSGKGGVGKSTVSVNLAMALSLEGYKVGLMDADVYGPNLPTMMGVTDSPKIQEIEGKEVFIPPSSHGIKVMSMGFLVEPGQPLIWRGPMLHNIITQFTHKVNWGELDFLVVDMPPGTGDVQLSLAQLVPISGSVLVTTPQEVSLQDVRKAFGMWNQVRVPVIGVVENMSYFVPDDSEKKYFLFGQGGGKRLADQYQTELLAELPLVIPVREGGDVGRPVVLENPELPVSKTFRDLAQKVASRVKDAEVSVQIGSFS